MKRCSLAVAVTLALSLLTSNVYAAEKITKTKPKPAAVTNLETIMVTARRYEESLQDIPIAVSAFNTRSLFEQNVQTLADLQGMVPNLQIGPTQGTTSTLTVYLRGIGQNNPLWGFDPEVGLYLNGVYIESAQ